jgi:iron complex transport system substrate-binding protein
MPLTRHALLLLAAVAAQPASAEPTRYPLSVDNCGNRLTFANAPQRAVTIGQSATEIVYSLGLGARLAGTSLWFNPVLPAYADIDARVPRLADNQPSFETVINRRPDLVAAQFEWSVGAQGAVATREQFGDLHIPAYVMPSDCQGKNNRVGADGTRLQPFRIDSLYQSIDELAAIFDVEDRGNALKQRLRDRLQAAQARLATQAPAATSVAFWFSSADLASDPYMAGRKGVPDYMASTLGLRNVVQSDEEWPTVGWESIAKANPTVLVIARMDRRRFPADDYRRKLEFLASDPVARQLDAVRHGRVVILDAQSMEASVRLFDGIEALAEAIDGFDLQP